MQAFIPCAGLGTRLRPLTDTCPKALVPWRGRPLLAHLLDKLEAAGYSRVWLNAYHFAEQIEVFVADYQGGLTLQISDERPLLLDTGGGLKRLLPQLDLQAPLLIYNVDILADLDLSAFGAWFAARPHLAAALAVQDRPSSRKLGFAQGLLYNWLRYDAQGQIEAERRLAQSPETAAYSPLAFSGIQLIRPQALAWPEALGEVFSLIDLYLAQAAQTPIAAYRHDQEAWMDLGRYRDWEALNASPNS